MKTYKLIIVRASVTSSASIFRSTMLKCYSDMELKHWQNVGEKCTMKTS